MRWLRQHSRAICIAVALGGFCCAVLGLVHVFGWADVPGGGFFVIATFPVLAAVHIIVDLLRRSPAPVRTGKER